LNSSDWLKAHSMPNSISMVHQQRFFSSPLGPYGNQKY
jgi:hypothetical protein